MPGFQAGHNGRAIEEPSKSHQRDSKETTTSTKYQEYLASRVAKMAAPSSACGMTRDHKVRVASETRSWCIKETSKTSQRHRRDITETSQRHHTRCPKPVPSAAQSHQRDIQKTSQRHQQRHHKAEISKIHQREKKAPSQRDHKVRVASETRPWCMRLLQFFLIIFEST